MEQHKVADGLWGLIDHYGGEQPPDPDSLFSDLEKGEVCGPYIQPMESEWIGLRWAPTEEIIFDGIL